MQSHDVIYFNFQMLGIRTLKAVEKSAMHAGHRTPDTDSRYDGSGVGASAGRCVTLFSLYGPKLQRLRCSGIQANINLTIDR